MIREIGGVECTNDVYARSPSRFEYWYIGKLARTDGTVGIRVAVAKCVEYDGRACYAIKAC